MVVFHKKVILQFMSFLFVSSHFIGSDNISSFFISNQNCWGVVLPAFYIIYSFIKSHIECCRVS